MSEGIVEKIFVEVHGADGSVARSVELDPRVFGAAEYERCVHQTVVWQRNKRRAGTHSTLTKGMMQGGSKKPWQQKGTGRARAGTSTSPVWVGGGVAHGPQPRDYSTRQNRRERSRALATVLSQKVAAKELLVVSGFEVASGKTKDAVLALGRLGLDSGKGVCVLIDGLSAKTERALRNIPGVLLRKAAGLNVYDLLSHEMVMADEQTVASVQAQVADRLG